MADVLVKPAFQSAQSDTGDATRLGPTFWNASRLFSGGNNGELVVRDASSATGAAWSAAIPTSYTIGDLLYASSTSALSALADVAVNAVLVSGGVGVAPAWNANPTVTTLTSTGQITSGSHFLASGTGSIYWSARTVLESPANGQLRLTNNAGTAGVAFDFSTDALVLVRTRAVSAYATVDCLGLKASGVAGVNFGPAHPASITIVNGIVTAAS